MKHHKHYPESEEHTGVEATKYKRRWGTQENVCFSFDFLISGIQEATEMTEKDIQHRESSPQRTTPKVMEMMSVLYPFGSLVLIN